MARQICLLPAALGPVDSICHVHGGGIGAPSRTLLVDTPPRRHSAASQTRRFRDLNIESRRSCVSLRRPCSIRAQNAKQGADVSSGTDSPGRDFLPRDEMDDRANRLPPPDQPGQSQMALVNGRLTGKETPFVLGGGSVSRSGFPAARGQRGPSPRAMPFVPSSPITGADKIRKPNDSNMSVLLSVVPFRFAGPLLSSSMTQSKIITLRYITVTEFS